MVDHGAACGGAGGDWATPKTGQPKSTSTYGYSSATTSASYTRPSYSAPAPPPPVLNEDELEYWHYAVELSGRINQGRDVIYKHFLTQLTNQGGRSNIPPYVWTGECSRVMSLDLASGSFVEHDDFPGLRRKISPIYPRALKLAPFFVSEDYNREQICVLGHNLRIPVGFFADHVTTDEGTVHMDAIRNSPTIESNQEAADPSQDTRIIIRYPVITPNEARANHPRTSGHAMTGQSTYAASVVERQIETPSQYDEWDHEGLVVTASAQLSYWIRGKGKIGEGSTVLLVDPPISKLVPDESWRNLVRLAEFEDPKGRVPVAVTQPSTITTTDLYTNTCLYADIQLLISQTQPTPEQVLAFARRFALNNWIALINHARACLNKLRSKLYSSGIKSSSVRKHSKHASHNSPTDNYYSPNYSGGPFAEWILERLADWSTSLAFYMMDVEANMLALGINIDDPSSWGNVSKKEAQQWRYIHHTLGVYRDLYRQTADSYTQVTALREAQQVGKLTRLGVLFLPAGFVAGLLSMGGDFLPGQSQFWVFWVVALPVVAIVWAVLGMEGSLREKLKGLGNRL
ncbi:hypothetical protein V8F06_011161 [Rhypophila decipiens]